MIEWTIEKSEFCFPNFVRRHAWSAFASLLWWPAWACWTLANPRSVQPQRGPNGIDIRQYFWREFWGILGFERFMGIFGFGRLLGPSLTLGQSNRAPVPTASTYVNFLEGILGDFRIWEIYGDFWIWGTLGILPPPQSVQLCCGPNGIIPHWHFWGIWSSGISFSSVNSKCDLKCIDSESWPLGPWVLLLGIAPCWGVEWIHNLGRLELLGYWKYWDIGNIGNIGYFLKYWKYWDIFWGIEWTHNLGRVEMLEKKTFF